MAMTRRDREDLAKVVRRREKLTKGDADRLAAERLAGFESQLAAIYKPGDDPVWQELYAAAATAVAEVKAKLAERCRELGIPEDWAPDLQLRWYGRGENAAAERRAELRRVAKTRIDADAKAAKVEIEKRSVAVQEQLIARGLDSEDAKVFLESMPTAEQLMPSVSVAEIEAAATAEGRRAVERSGRLMAETSQLARELNVDLDL
jgi:hypothetical protein